MKAPSIKSVRDACTPRPEVLKGDLEDAIFAADFGLVIEGRGADVYRKPTDFFQNTHPAQRLKKVVSTIFERLADAKEAGAAVRLSTGFGGGKTHTLIALWHLATNITKTSLGTDLLPAAGRPKSVAVAGIDAHKGLTAKSLWGELALRFGGKAGLAKLKTHDDPHQMPNAQLVRSLLPDEPVLILLDELVIYMAGLDAQAQGVLLGFLNLLIAEIAARRQAVLVITDPGAQPAYSQEAAALAKATSELQAAQRLDNILDRKTSEFDPIGDESAQVILRRLFEDVDGDTASAVSAEYFDACKRVLAEHPDALPTDALDYAKRIAVTYPFHPRLLETAQERLGALQDFHKSRGTLRLFGRILRDVWEAESSLTLITAGDLDWGSDRIQADLLRRLKRDNFMAAVSADVQRHAGQLDETFSTDAHRRAASALLLESLPHTAQAAMDRRELTLAVLRPSDVGHEPGEALDRLYSVCWHTYKDDSGAKFQFRYDPNVNKLIEERACKVLIEDARHDVLTLAQGYFTGKTFTLIPFPSTPKTVSDSAELKLVLCESESLAQAVCDFEDDSDPAVKRKRPFRNAIFGVAPAADSLSEAVDAMRRLKAAEEIHTEEKKNKSLREQVEELVPSLRKRTRIRTYRAFSRVVFQGRKPVTLAEKYLVPEDGALEAVHGQQKLKEFLDDNKLVYAFSDALDVDLFVDSILKGATPSLDHPGAFPASAVHERALCYEKLRLLLDGNPVRNATIQAVQAGRLVVRLPNGDAYDKTGCVSAASGVRTHFPGRPLSTFKLESDVLLAPTAAECIKDWLKVEEPTTSAKGKKAKPEPPPEPETLTVADWTEAATAAAKRPLLRLTFKAPTPDTARTLIAVAAPFGAKSLALTVRTGGEVKDGGSIQFMAENLKHNSALKPIEAAAQLYRALKGDSASFEVEMALDFGEAGLSAAADKLTSAHEQAADDVSLLASFGKEAK